jgi:hypothetical protein
MAAGRGERRSGSAAGLYLRPCRRPGARDAVSRGAGARPAGGPRLPVAGWTASGAGDRGVLAVRRADAEVALLRLDAVFEGARPVQLVDGTGVWGHTFRAFDFPAGADSGM